MKTYAIIQDGLVTNVILWDGISTYAIDGTPVDVTSLSPQPGIGWTYDGVNFTAPVVYSAGTSS